ncbi:hypothetical protein DFH28DRAFT_912905, partial [Melampsora americana]
QLRSGHCQLNAHLFRINKEKSDRCNFCRQKETVTHYLVYCKKFKKQRAKLTFEINKQKLKINKNSAKHLLDTPQGFKLLAKYCLETGRFKNLKTYVEDTN